MTYSKDDHEKYLNELYSYTYNYDETLDNFSHLYKINTFARIHLLSHYENHTLGTLMRKKDQIAFNISFNDEKRLREK